MPGNLMRFKEQWLIRCGWMMMDVGNLLSTHTYIIIYIYKSWGYNGTLSDWVPPPGTYTVHQGPGFLDWFSMGCQNMGFVNLNTQHPERLLNSDVDVIERCYVHVLSWQFSYTCSYIVSICCYIPCAHHFHAYAYSKEWSICNNESTEHEYIVIYFYIV